MDSKSLIGGLLAAAVIGAAIGILLAPESGEKTRGKLAKGSRKLTNSLKDTVEDSIGSLKDKFTAGIGEVISKGKEVANNSGDRLKI
jgi:gas vesicle protein